MSEQPRKLESIYTTFQMRKLRIQEFDTKSKIVFLGRGEIQLPELVFSNILPWLSTIAI